LQRMTHTLKSSSASVGARAMAAVAARAEQQLRSGAPLAADLAEHLQSELERLRAALQQLHPPAAVTSGAAA